MSLVAMWINCYANIKTANNTQANTDGIASLHNFKGMSLKDGGSKNREQIKKNRKHKPHINV